MNRVPMTQQGEAQLKEELQELKRVKRPRVVQAIATAREHGDLKENAEYHAAKEEQGFIEGRIKEIESKLSMADVIDPSKMNANGRVIFGATVTVFNVDTEQEVTYKIVGDDEADIKLGKISVSSPIARALIGKSIDDEVSVQTPGGQVDYEITEVTYQ